MGYDLKLPYPISMRIDKEILVIYDYFLLK